MFFIFGLGVPVYFMMSVNRGIFQGQKEFERLSVTYQGEMISRLMITLLFLFLLPFNSSVLVAFGLLISFVFGLFPFRLQNTFIKKRATLTTENRTMVLRFIMLTAFYELTQIIINNSDILLVKHYFGSYEAGLYASLALIGRVVYFVAWMFVMLLLPTVVNLHKEGKAHSQVLFRYVFYIGILATFIVLCTYLFPQLIVKLMFGDEYVSISPLLWKYALATSVFAIANIFAYYFLSVDKYIPVLLSAVMGITQVALIIWFHESLEQVVQMQIIAMCALLVMQILFFAFYNKSRITV